MDKAQGHARKHLGLNSCWLQNGRWTLLRATSSTEERHKGWNHCTWPQVTVGLASSSHAPFENVPHRLMVNFFCCHGRPSMRLHGEKHDRRLFTWVLSYEQRNAKEYEVSRVFWGLWKFPGGVARGEYWNSKLLLWSSSLRSVSRGGQSQSSKPSLVGL